MFGKIKDRLKDVFSKTDEIIEEDESIKSEEEGNDNNLEKEIEELEQETSEIDELEKEIEEEIDETEKDIQDEEEQIKEDELRDEESIEEEISQEDKELEEIDELEKKIEEEIGDIEEEIEQEEENIKKDEEELEEENSQKKGFFSRMWGKTEKKEIIEEDSQEDLNKKEESDDDLEKDIKEEIGPEEDEKEHKEGFLQSALSSVTQKKIGTDEFLVLWTELELFLLEINIAYEIVEKIERKLKDQVIGNKFSRFSLKEKTREVLVAEISNVMHTRETDFKKIIEQHLEDERPLTIMMLGVNGTGKTTTIGKLITYFKKNNLSIVVAAADTFRAAAVEQVKEHCENLEVKCVAHKQGADPAAVCYDAIEHAKAKNLDIVLIDTAGRMPNNKNLMEELKKIKRVSNTKEVIFIGDSISGNDLIDQINLFNEGLGVTGVILTKVDTDERPGSVVTTAYSINTPIYFLGHGQTYEDLTEFKAQEIAEKLFDE